MTARNANARRVSALLFAGLLLVVLAQDRPMTTGPVTAIYTAGVLRVSIPYDAARTAGDLKLEVVDPEDRVVGHLDRRVYLAGGRGVWNQDLELPRTLALDDLVWHRLRYQFTRENETTPEWEGIRSISQILRRPVVRVLGQQSYLSGGAAAVRVVVVDSQSDAAVGEGSVRIELQAPGSEPRPLYSGRLNQRGTVQADFRFPAGLAGSYLLHFAVETALGSAEYTQNIQMEDKVSVLLTTEKPIYQPSQTIHVRALALDRANHQATAARPLTFELEDSRGNKVFRKATQTDSYGIASAEFALADEVNLGTYHLRAQLQGSADAQLALQVERYVLPKFKVAVDLTGRNDARKRGYRPGDHVTGTVRANYFFGKAVDGAEISVKASASDVAAFEVGNSRGTTDSDGAFRFDIQLPVYFAGHPLNHGTAQVVIEASVKDHAGHTESHGELITVSESPLLVTAVPEGGRLIPGLENQVFLLTSYSDGAPAVADLRVQIPGSTERHVTTDSGGVAIVPLTPTAAAMTLAIDATDKEGNHASVPVTLQSGAGSDQILLRTERAIYRAGDRIHLQVFSTRPKGTAYVDAIKDGQTVATRDLDIANGRADLEFAATPELAGTVDFHAYILGRDATIGDHRLVFVQPADELKIETALDAASYKPGGEARIDFRVTNGRGEGVQAALGLQIVDQAVFSLAEQRPGFAKLFFYLEQEAMKPRYEIDSADLPSVLSTDYAGSGRRDLAARALFAATEMVRPDQPKVEFGRGMPQSRYPQYAARYVERFRAQVARLGDLVRLADQNVTEDCDYDRITSMLLASPSSDLTDSWGSKVRIERAGAAGVSVRSAGPDGQFLTGDDLVQPLQSLGCVQPNFYGSGRISLHFTNNFRLEGAVEVSGSVADVTGARIARAKVALVEAGSGKEHDVTTGVDGRFRFTAISEGRYRIRITAPGFAMASREFSVRPHDRAELSVTLQIGSMTQTVDVNASAITLVSANSGVLPVVLLDGASARNAGRTLELPVNGRSMNFLALARNDAPKSPSPADPATHVRSWFPEALYIAPEIITDKQGRASITVPIADNITTWRMAMLASTTHGALGSGTGSLKVFQDFFVDLDLPVTLTQGDQVSIPVAVYNYSGSRGSVQLQLQPDTWYTPEGDAAKTVAVESDQVGGSQFTITANRIGKFKLTLKASMEGAAKRADIVIREIEVVPNGREQSLVFNGRLDSAVRHSVDFPADSIPDASSIFVRLYPGPLSQVVEGMDSLLRMPSGCFEQTSSSTYPNVLSLDYMKRTKKLTPEIRAKAESYIASGYQRLLTFEVQGGGFSWFGNAPANKILTSYGLMEFSDMAKVHDVDPKVIQRTQEWLAGQQQADGSWKPDQSFINEGATNRYNVDALRITGYVAWALENTGYRGDAVEKAKRFIEAHLASEKPDVYTLAVLANFAVDDAKDSSFARRVMDLLLAARTEEGDKVWWNAQETSVYASGTSAIAETTGLATQALLKLGGSPAVAAKAMNYIVSKKDTAGTWGTTQATIMALRALLLSTERGAATAKGVVEVILNGRTVERLELTAANNDLFHQVVLHQVNPQSSNQVELRFQGEGTLAYQVAGRYFLPWSERPDAEPLSITVAYDRTRLAQNDIATATATVRNNLSRPAAMVMVDLGIPPGFDLLSEDLEAYRESSASFGSGRLEKFTLTPTQAILYFDSIAPGAAFDLQFRLRAKYPIRTKAFASRVYEYYNPEIASQSRPIPIEVRR